MAPSVKAGNRCMSMVQSKLTYDFMCGCSPRKAQSSGAQAVDATTHAAAQGGEGRAGRRGKRTRLKYSNSSVVKDRKATGASCHAHLRSGNATPQSLNL